MIVISYQTVSVGGSLSAGRLWTLMLLRDFSDKHIGHEGLRLLSSDGIVFMQETHVERREEDKISEMVESKQAKAW